MISKSNELNDLFDYDYKIYQNPDYFKFSIDSVLLAEFVELKKNKTDLLDLCSGNAPIPLILNKKYGDKLNITGVELQKDIYQLGLDSIKYNNVNNIEFINSDVNDLLDVFPNKKFHYITCNPPYFKVEESSENINSNEVKAIARHELKIDLEKIVSISSKLLYNQGYFYLVHVPTRLADIINICNKYKFGIKRIVPVYNDFNTDSCFVLVEAVLNGKDYVKVEKPVYIKQNGTYKEIFRK